jgi:hypothetical protein
MAKKEDKFGIGGKKTAAQRDEIWKKDLEALRKEYKKKAEKRRAEELKEGIISLTGLFNTVRTIGWERRGPIRYSEETTLTVRVNVQSIRGIVPWEDETTRVYLTEDNEDLRRRGIRGSTKLVDIKGTPEDVWKKIEETPPKIQKKLKISKPSA